MDTLQEKHERAVGDAFVDWYNRRKGTSFEYYARGADPPDLVYRNGTEELPLEITAAYYDDGHATMLWQDARDSPDAPDSWKSKSPDEKLITSVNLALGKKSGKTYPSGCVLVVAIYPELTAADEFAALLPEINVPVGHPFAAIYIGGLFPETKWSVGGYSWWRLSP